MRQFVEEEEFEEAAACKKKIKALEATQQSLTLQVKTSISSALATQNQNTANK